MAITILVNGVPLTADSGATIPLSPSAEISIVVDGVVLDPTDPSQVGLSVSPPNLTLTLADGQVLTLAGFVDPTGTAGGGLLGPDGTIAVASSAEALIQAAAGPTSPEPGLEPGAGGTPGGPGGVDAGGSSVAVVTYFEDGFGNLFGISPSGDFIPLGLLGFDVPFFDELPLLLGDDVLEILLEELGEFLLFTDSLILPDLSNPGAPDDFAFFNVPGASLFIPDGTINSAFDDGSGSSGLPIDLNITNAMNGNDTVELADKGNPNGNNLKELFGEPTAFYGGTGDDTLTGGTDNDIIVGDGQEVDNGVMDCTDDRKDKKDEGDHHKHHKETVVLKGDDDTIDGGSGDDTILGDGLTSKPGFDPAQRNTGFPNLVDPTASFDISSMHMPADLKLNFLLGLLGPGVLKNVLDVEIEKQAKIKVAGGEDTLLGGEGDDLVVGDALLVVEGRGGKHHHRDDYDSEEPIQEQGLEGASEGWREHDHGGRPQIVIKGGDDTIEGNAGDDKLLGDGIARVPSALFGDPHGGDAYHDLGHGIRNTSARLEGGGDTVFGNDGNDKIIGDSIINVAAKAKSGKELSAKIAFFSNSEFVSPFEADEMRSNLDDLGHKIRTFTGTSAEEIEAALAGKDVLVIPELTAGGLATALTPEAVDVIRAFIEAGGRLIVVGDSDPSAAPDFINVLLGTSVSQVDAGVTSFKTPEAKLTAFEKGPDQLADLNSRGLIDLPTDGSATSLYQTPSGVSTVARFSLGHGSVTFFGEDWFDFVSNPGSIEGEEGWIDLLDIAVTPDPAGVFGGHDTLIGGDGQDMMAGDGLVNVEALPNDNGHDDCSPTCPAFSNPCSAYGGGEYGGTLVKGGHDIMHGDSPDDPQGMKIALFANGDFVNLGRFGGDDEATEVQATLQALGNEVMPFTGISETEITEALEGKDVLVFPELSEVNAENELNFSEAALDVIREFVRGGGKLIVHGTTSDSLNNAGNLINDLFGHSVDEEPANGSNLLVDDEASGTVFEGGPESIPTNVSTRALTNLPDNAKSIYTDEDGEGTVTLFEEESGQVLYLGWDWIFSAPAPGSADGGWIEVLRRFVEMDTGGNDDLMLGDAILNVTVETHYDDDYQPNPNTSEEGENGDYHYGRTIVEGGDDSMFGGAGDDKMVGDAILAASSVYQLDYIGADAEGFDPWAHQDFWFDEDLLFADLLQKDRKHDKDWDRDRRDIYDHEPKLFGGNDTMLGGAGDDWIRGDGLWQVADHDDHGPYSYKDDTPPAKLEKADNAWDGHDVLFGGLGNDKVWGEGGHDFIAGDGFTTGLGEDLRSLFDGVVLGDLDIIIPDFGIETAEVDEDPFLAALFEAGAILEGFEDIAGGFLLGGNDHLIGGDDDRGHINGSPTPGIANGNGDDDHHDDAPFWREFGIDDVVLGDGLLGLTGSLAPLASSSFAKVLPEDVRLALADHEGLSTFGAGGGGDTIEGNSGNDVLAGDAIVALNIAFSIDESPSPGPFPGPDPLFNEESTLINMIGGGDTMWGDDAEDHKKGHKGHHGGGQKKSTSGDNWDDDVGYDDFMFGDLLLGLDIGDFVADLAGFPPEFSTTGPAEINALGGRDTMAGGRGQDLIYGDAILLATGLADAGEEAFNPNDPLSLFSMAADLETSFTEDAEIFAEGGNDVIYGDSIHDAKKRHHDKPGGKKMTSDGEWFDDHIIGDGIIAVGGIQKLFGGFDTIWGGKGNDVILGDGIVAGDSTFASLVGGGDIIDGGKGDDLIYGDLLLNDNVDNFDFDVLDAASFAEGRIQEARSNDTDAARGFGDTLQGGKGDDTVYGELGDDTVDGGKGLDIVFGGDGSDLGIWKDPTVDPEFMNYGDDSLIFPGSDNGVTGVTDGVPVGEADFYDGNIGNFDGLGFQSGTTQKGPDGPNEDIDTLRFVLTEEQLASAAFLAELVAYEEHVEVDGNDDIAFVFTTIPLVAVEWEAIEFAIKGCEDHVVEDLLTGSSITGTELDELIVGTAGGDELAGDDDHEEALSNDVILGLAGNDTLLGDRDENLEGERGGDDKLVGGEDNDVLVGDTGVESGESGNDIVGGEDGVAEEDVSRGGDDKLFGDFFNPYANEGGEEGEDEIYGDAFNDILDGGQGGDDLLVGGGDEDSLFGDAGEDISGTITASEGDDDLLVRSAGGNDTLYGDYAGGYADDDGDDEISGDAGENIDLGGQGGNDTLVGGGDDDRLQGDAGNNLQRAALGGDDLLIGDFDLGAEEGHGKDRDWSDDLFGGDDTISGDAGNDILRGDGALTPPNVVGGGQTKGGEDTLIGDSRVIADLSSDHGHWGDGLPRIPTAGKDFLAGDAGQDISLANTTAPIEGDVRQIFGLDDELYGDNFIDITLGEAKHDKGDQPALLELLGSNDDTMSGDAGAQIIGTSRTPPLGDLQAVGGSDTLVGDTALTIKGTPSEDEHGGDDWYGWSGDWGNDPIDPSDLTDLVGDDVIAGDALGVDFSSDGTFVGGMEKASGGRDVIYGDFTIELEDLGKHESAFKHEIIEILDALGISPFGYDDPVPYEALELQELLDLMLDNLGGDDKLAGGTTGDMVDSFDGFDIIHGQGGDDLIAGEALGRMIDSTGSFDQIYGGGGNDIIAGESFGDDAESLHRGDRIEGGKGDDIISGDVFDGDGVDDATSVKDDSDRLDGDRIEGEYGDDVIFGDVGYTDRNAIKGTAIEADLDGADGTGDRLFGGHGNDTVIGDAGDDIDATSEAHDNTGGDDTIEGGEGNDLLIGDAGDRLMGTSVDDELMGGRGGADTITGDDGDDVIYGDAGGQRTAGTDVRGDAHETDQSGTVVGGDGLGGDDTMDGGAGTDTIFGGGGSDVGIWRGADHSYGGPDVYDGGGGTGGDVFSMDESDFDEGTDGDGTIDTLRLILTGEQFSDEAVWADIFALQAQIDAGDDDKIYNFTTLDLSVIEWEEVRIGIEHCPDLLIDPTTIEFGDDNLDDTITGTLGAGQGVDAIFGLGGGDTLIGDGGEDGLGDDALVGGDDNDILLGDTDTSLQGDGVVGGNDKLFGGEGVDTIVGDTGVVDGQRDVEQGAVGGNDVAFGGAGDDWISGDAGDEIDEGGLGGDDKIYGDGGDDVLFGDAGNSNLASPGMADATGGVDTIVGGEGNDTAFGETGGSFLTEGAVDGEFLPTLGGDDLIVGDELEEIDLDFDLGIGNLGNIDSSVIVERTSGNDTLHGDAGGSIIGLSGPFSEGGNDRMVGDNFTLGTITLSVGLLIDDLVDVVGQRGDDSMTGDAGGDLGDRFSAFFEPGHGGDDWMVGDDAYDLLLDGSIDIFPDFNNNLASLGLDGASLNGNDVISGDAGGGIFGFSLGGNDTLIGDNSLALTGEIDVTVSDILPFIADTGEIEPTNETEAPEGGNDVIYGDARDLITAGDGGNDTIIGDNALDITLGINVDLSGLVRLGPGNGGSLFDLFRLVHSGDDWLFGDSGSALLGQSIFGSGLTIGTFGGDDLVIGDNQINLDLSVDFHFDELLNTADAPAASTALNGDEGLLNGGHDTIFGDAGSDILGGNSRIIGSGVSTAGSANGGDDSLIGDHAIDVTLSIDAKALDDFLFGTRSLASISTAGTFAGGLLNGGNDIIYGDTKNTLAGGDAEAIGTETVANGGNVRGGDDHIVGDHELSLDLHVAGSGFGLYSLIDSFGAFGFGLEGGLLNGGHDILHGDTGGILKSGFFIFGSTGDAFGGTANGGDDWIAGDHDLEVTLDLSHLSDGLIRGAIVDAEDVAAQGITGGILNGGNDEIYGDAVSDIDVAEGGDDTLIGDHRLDITLSLPHSFGQTSVVGPVWSVSGVTGLDVQDGVLNGGHDRIYGDTGANMFGVPSSSSDDPDTEFRSTVAGDDRLIGDHDVSLTISGYGHGGGASSSGSLASLGLDGGFGRGGNDLLVGDAGAFIAGGSREFSDPDSPGPRPGQTFAGDDWIVGDHNIELHLSYYVGDGIGWLGDGGHDTILGDTELLFSGAFGGDDFIIGDHHIIFDGGLDYGEGYDSADAWAATFGQNGAPFSDGEDYIVGDAGGSGKIVGFITSSNEFDITRAGNDTIYGDSLVYGGWNGWAAFGGADDIFGDTDGRIVNAIAGNDTLFGGGGDDFVTGDADEDDFIEVEESSEVRSFAIEDAQAGDDWIFGGAGFDELYGDAYGSAGISGTIDFPEEGSEPSPSPVPTVLGSSGFLETRLGDDDLWGGDDDDDIYGDVGEEILGLSGGNDLIYGGDGSDFIVGDSGGEIRDQLLGDETLDGAGGDDSLVGGKGDDEIVGDTDSNLDDFSVGGDDEIFGDEDDDTLTGDAGNDIQDGARGGNDTLVGGSGNDTLYGDALDRIEEGNLDVAGFGGDDLLLGGSGSDLLVGDAGDKVDENSEGGDDTLKGGKGEDTLIGDAGTDIEDGGKGGDDLLDGGDDDDTLYGDAFSELELVGGDIAAEGGDDTLIGGKGDDTLFGDAGKDVDESIAGNDMLFGGKGDDTLVGDAGDELDVDAVAGDDLLDGGSGNDMLWGDAVGIIDATATTGSDTFVMWALGNGDDIIKDFEVEKDILRFADIVDIDGGGAGISDLALNGVTAEAADGNLIINFADGGSTTVEGIGMTFGPGPVSMETLAAAITVEIEEGTEVVIQA